MKAVVLKSPKKFTVEEVPIPQPRPGEVLVRIESSPINPSDILLLKGKYPLKNTYPVIPGFEGSGIVVSNGGGILGWMLQGKRVAVGSREGNGFWAEYTVVPAKSCVILPENISFNLGACMFANPFTVMLFGEKIKAVKHSAVVQTAAASSLGKMLIRYLKSEGIPLINIVRRSEQVEMLQELGCEYVLNSSHENFQVELKKMCEDLNATIAFDCVSGEMTGVLVNSMCDNSVVYVYGMLSGQDVQGISPSAVIFSNKRVEGLLLDNLVNSKSFIAKLKLCTKVLSLLPTILKTECSQEFQLERIVSALKFYKKNMSTGKVILKPLKQVKIN